MIKIAVTGNVGSGKSTVLEFISRSFPVLNADTLAHEIIEVKKLELKEIFGESIFSREQVDRKKLGKIVFNDDAALKKLNAVIHPELKRIIKNYQNKEGIVFIEIALLFELGLENDFQKIILVTSDQDIRYQRLLNKDWSLEKITSIFNNQINSEQYLQKVDYIIENNDKIEVSSLSLQIKKIINEWREYEKKQ